MKDEIKEILNQLEIVARKHTIEVCEDGSKIETMSANVVDELRLNNYSSKILLDYITNLQESEAYYYGYYKDYKSRNEKAIEYIHNHQPVFELSNKKQIQEWFEKLYYIELLNILNGGDEE